MKFVVEQLCYVNVHFGYVQHRREARHVGCRRTR